MSQTHADKHAKHANAVVIDSYLGQMRVVLSARIVQQATQATGLTNAAEAIAKLINDAPTKRFEALEHGDHERQDSKRGALHLHLNGLQEPLTLRFDDLHVRNAEQALENHLSNGTSVGAALVAKALGRQPVTAHAIHERGVFLG